MEIKILESSKHKIVAEFVGLDHTLCNVLKKELWEDADVKAAAYAVDHPLVSHPRFIVETAKKAPKAAIMAALSRLEKKNKSFLEVIKKAK